MVVPDEALKYILYQRTEYLSVFSRGIELVLPALYKKAIDLELKLINKEKLKQKFASRMYAEFEELKPYLPASCNSVLDIGCGVGGIDVPIAKHYGGEADIYLFDKTEVAEKIYYKYENKGAFYNSLDIAKGLLTANGIPESRVFAIEARENKIPDGRKYDLIISLISWGFHYPMTTYLDSVCENLAPGGVVIVDSRINSEGFEALKKKFENCRIINNNPSDKKNKCLRVACMHPN